jgi:conjugative transposon TraM protein
MDRLERLLTSLKQSGSAGSPEMQELNRTLDKLIAVQQPVRAKPGIASTVGLLATDSSMIALRVLPVGKEAAISGMQLAEPARNQFYDLESNDGGEQPMGTAIEAIVPETQTLVNGSTIRLELATELTIRGQRVAKGTTMYGTVRLSNERLQVSVTSIRSGKDVFPVALRVLDQDGLAGIYSPGSATRDAAQESAGEAAASLGPAGLDASPSGQALSAGIQLARNLARRKVQLTRVTVKAGYRVFLQDESKGH